MIIRHLSKLKTIIQNIGKERKSLLFILLAALYPVVFLLAENAQIVKIQSIILPIVIYITMYLLFFILIKIVAKISSSSAIIALLIFSVGFNTYGFIFDFFTRVDRFPVTHILIFPVYLSLLIYSSTQLPRIIKRISNPLANGLILILAGLLLFNLYQYMTPKVNQILHSETGLGNTVSSKTVVPASTELNRPDIYYFVLDEAINFNQGADFFEDPDFLLYADQLKERGFFVPQDSKSRTTRTLHEVASRLNNFIYPEESEAEELYNAITNNKLFYILKQYGYTSVVFDGTAMPLFYATKIPIKADVDLKDRVATNLGYSFAFDGFSQLLFNGTLLRPLAEKLTISDPELGQLREETLFILNRAKDLSDIPSPKVTYFHIMAAHRPFIFERDGKPIDPQFRSDWNYYPSSYKFLMDEMLDIVDSIQSSATTSNHPVIIIQSDHGARITDITYSGTAEYPEEYKRSIINAVYLPGFDYSALKSDLDPMDIFPMVLKNYLHVDMK